MSLLSEDVSKVGADQREARKGHKLASVFPS